MISAFPCFNESKVDGPRIVVACEVMRQELEAHLAGAHDVEVAYLEQSLHRAPEILRETLRDVLAAVSQRAGQIVLGYGLCSNGAVGLEAPRQGLLIPRVHDCISLFLGSRDAYDRAFNERCGTYYLTPGWIEAQKDPLGMLEHDYIPRVGRETAIWALEEELKHYTHIALITPGRGDIESLRDRAKENARYLRKEYIEMPGSDVFFKKIVFGPYGEGDFVRVKPRETVRQDAFL